MTTIAPEHVPLPAEARDALVLLGRRLRAHRMQRNWTIAETAERLLCSPTTWRALEGGRPGTGIGLLAHALWLFGELDSLGRVAPSPVAPLGRRRARRSVTRPLPGVISDDERDF